MFHKSGDIAIIHSIKTVYATLYQMGKKLPKSDKLGIHARAEEVALDAMNGIIQSAFSRKAQKISILENVRVSLEIIKHLVRTEHELHIIDEKTYLRIAILVVETSKMTNGWIKYLSAQTQNPTS